MDEIKQMEKQFFKDIKQYLAGKKIDLVNYCKKIDEQLFVSSERETNHALSIAFAIRQSKLDKDPASEFKSTRASITKKVQSKC